MEQEIIWMDKTIMDGRTLQIDDVRDVLPSLDQICLPLDLLLGRFPPGVVQPCIKIWK